MADFKDSKEDPSLENEVTFSDLGAQILADEDFAAEPVPVEEKAVATLIDNDLSHAHMQAMLRVAESMEKIVSRQEETRQIPYSEVKPVSSFNPTGRRDHPQFTRITHMDGITLNSLMHSAEEIQLFNKLKPGRYWDRKIEVRRGSNGEIDLVRIGSRLDQRMERNAKFPTLTSMLLLIIAEREEKERKRKAGIFEEEEAL